ncbi:hypothetical protein JCM10213v2_007318 [Rhodosporidiobolus nylandii]
MPSVSDWQATATQKRESFAQQIASLGFKTPDVSSKVLDVTSVPLEDVLGAKQVEITEADVAILLEKLQKGEWSAVEVTEAFCHRAVIAHQLVNCLTEVFFDKALARAKQLDEIFAKSGPVGPLHGLPISLKNQICVEGVECNMGYTGWIGRVAEKNSVLAECLVKQGAVLYCQTNVPQSLMSTDYGRTVNPYNRNLSCGGSSGGEGALVGFRGSPAGFGSDIGGSIRVPSAFNGLYGFRGSYNRIPYGGSVNSCEGLEAVSSVLGPLTVSIDGLRTLVKSVLDAEPWRADPLALHMPWREEAYQLCEHGGGKEPLVFAFMADNGLVKPLPPYQRAMEMTKKALIAKGHKVIDWALPDQAKMFDTLGRIYSADGGQDIDTECGRSGEPRLWGLFEEGNPPKLSTYEYWQLCFERRKFIATQLAAWESTASLTGTGRPVDAIILPVSPYPSFPHDAKQEVSYTGVCNLNDFPTGIVPVTRVDPKVDVKQERTDFYEYAFDKENWERYDPEFFANAPIGLQVAGRKGEDEAVIRFTEIVDEALKALKQ